MPSKSKRQFREVLLKSGDGVNILSVITGKQVKVTLRNLNNHEKEILSKVCDFIEGKLKGTSFERDFEILTSVTGFCATSSKHLGAYTFKLGDAPMVIFNSKVITSSFDELAVTVLHELLHHANDEPVDKDYASLDEARHDLACYGLLGIPVSLDHWAFTRYPDLKNEWLEDSED